MEKKITIFPIAYKKDERELEVLPEFIPHRKDQIWGYEILPGLVISKKCQNASWITAKNIAECLVFNGKQGHLPSKEIFKAWETGLSRKIEKMDEFFRNEGVNASHYYKGPYKGYVWCSESSGDCDELAYSFELDFGLIGLEPKEDVTSLDRPAVAF